MSTSHSDNMFLLTNLTMCIALKINDIYMDSPHTVAFRVPNMWFLFRELFLFQHNAMANLIHTNMGNILIITICTSPCRFQHPHLGPLL